MKVAILKRGLSDHCPLHVHTHTMDWGPKPFKFHNCWLADPNCLKLIRESWTKQAKGTMPEKLKAIKQNLKEWNCSNFGNIDANIRRLEDVISEIDNLGRQKAQSDLWEWMKRKEVYWAQQSRITWLKEGDKNTKFFHAIASIKRRKNMILSIDVNGKNISEPSQIKFEARKFFKNIFKEDDVNRPTLENLHLNSLSQAQPQSLVSPFSKDEIDQAVSSCDADKAPGPDGFNFKFVKKCMGHHKT